MRSTSLVFVTTGVLTLTTGAFAQPRATQPDSTLVGLSRLVGEWAPSPRVARRPGQRVVHDYSWTVGGKALRMRENYALGDPEQAEVDGLVFWNPALERIQFVAVGGHGPGQGRYFEGEYRVLADGAVERVYDVYYRTLAIRREKSWVEGAAAIEKCTGG